MRGKQNRNRKKKENEKKERRTWSSVRPMASHFKWNWAIFSAERRYRWVWLRNGLSSLLQKKKEKSMCVTFFVITEEGGAVVFFMAAVPYFSLSHHHRHARWELLMCWFICRRIKTLEPSYCAIGKSTHSRRGEAENAKCFSAIKMQGVVHMSLHPLSHADAGGGGCGDGTNITLYFTSLMLYVVKSRGRRGLRLSSLWEDVLTASSSSLFPWNWNYKTAATKGFPYRVSTQ